MKIELIYTDYEKYLADNLAAIIINSGGSVVMNEIMTNGNYFVGKKSSYRKILIFPSNYITFYSSSEIEFLEKFISIGSLNDIFCIDYTQVSDLANKSKCLSVLSFLSTKFKCLKKITSNVCLDDLFHKKVGVNNDSKFEYIYLDNERFRGIKNKQLNQFNQPKIKMLLDANFDFYDFIFALETVDFCVLNYQPDPNSLICQICNYLNKPLVTSDLSYNNISSFKEDFMNKLLSSDHEMPYEYLNNLMKADLVNRDQLKKQFLSLIKQY